MDSGPNHQKRTRLLVAIVALCVCGVAGAVLLCLRPSWLFESEVTHSIPDLPTVERQFNIRLPQTASVEVYEVHSFLDEQVSTKIVINKKDVEQFIADSPFAAVALSTTQQYVFGGRYSPKGWVPDSAKLFRSGSVQTPPPRRGLMSLLIDLDHPDTAVIYLVWGSA